MREHLRGRRLRDILDDPFVVEHASAAEAARLLDNPELIRRLFEEDAFTDAVTSEGLPPAA